MSFLQYQEQSRKLNTQNWPLPPPTKPHHPTHNTKQASYKLTKANPPISFIFYQLHSESFQLGNQALPRLCLWYLVSWPHRPMPWCHTQGPYGTWCPSDKLARKESTTRTCERTINKDHHSAPKALPSYSWQHKYTVRNHTTAYYIDLNMHICFEFGKSRFLTQGTYAQSCSIYYKYYIL